MISATELVTLTAASVESGALVSAATAAVLLAAVFADVGGTVVIVLGRLEVLQAH